MLLANSSFFGDFAAFFMSLTDTQGFPARWNCGSAWAEEPEVGWMHIVSDISIFSAYFAIPLILVYFLLRRRDLPFPKMILFFAVFILSCGIGHAIEAVIFWEPVYRLSGLVKVITALASWATVIALVPMVPRILDLPTLENLTKRLQEEIEERKKMEAQFRAIVSSAPNGFLMIDQEGRLKLLNKCAVEMFGYDEAELLDRPIEILLPEPLRQKHVQLRNDFQANPSERDMGEGRDLKGVTKSGKEFSVEVGLAPIQLEDETLVIASIVDISERKKSEQELLRYTKQLEESNRELDEFAYVASHDLKSPLQGVKNLALWIREDNGDVLSDESLQHLELLDHRICRMERLLEDLLTYSRIGKVEQKLSEVDVNIVVESIADDVSTAGFDIEIAPTMPVFQTYSVPLELCLRNLIQNAIKHHDRESGTIEVFHSESDQCFHFSVRDDGPGIAPEFHRRVFQMFETLKPRDDVEGSGMGLALIQKTIAAIGGSIRLESEIGQGSTFILDWPKHPQETPN